MESCRQCGIELPSSWITDICLECSKANVGKIFRENPEVKQAFHESIEEMQKPENVKKMADDTVRFMQAIQSIQRKKQVALWQRKSALDYLSVKCVQRSGKFKTIKEALIGNAKNYAAA